MTTLAPGPAVGEVTITRDTWGIGHAHTTSPEAAFWAQGWLAAADRLWQMEWDRLRLLGRWAAVAGPSAVAEDAFFRRIDLASVAQRSWDDLDDPARIMATAYAQGVNDWLAAAGPDDLPPELAHHPQPVTRWEPWHCVAVYQLRHLFMGTLHRKLWRGAVVARAGADLAHALAAGPAEGTPIVAGARPPLDVLAGAVEAMGAVASELVGLDVDGGSNSWALHGTRTASGQPLLAGDPHRGIEFPNVYHQCHLRCDEFDVIGLGFPGVPGFPHFGHNQSVAWAITHGMADDTDVFVEPGPLTVERVETIEVHGAEPVEVACTSTPRGPVILGGPPPGEASGGGGPAAVETPALSMAWTGFHGPDTTFNCLWPMLRAGSATELEEAVEDWVIPVNNLLVADDEGTITYRVRGRLVERPEASRWTPVPGDDAHTWDGREPVSFWRLPRWSNPERGFLVTANNKISDAGPYISVDFARSSRHDRVVQRLEALHGATVDDMAALHLDTVSLVAGPVVKRLLGARPATGVGEAAQGLLVGWDQDLTADSAAATVYGAARRHWSGVVAERADIADLALVEPGWPARPSASRMLHDGATNLLVGEGWRLVPGLDGPDELAAELGVVLDQVGAELEADLGPDPGRWRWDRVHTMVCPHPLAAARPELAHLHPPADAVPGDGDTIRASGAAPLTGDRAASASVARYVFDVADWDRSGWVVPHGVSGVRGSGHDLDQRPHWLAGELVPMAYSAEAVSAVATSVETITI